MLVIALATRTHRLSNRCDVWPGRLVRTVPISMRQRPVPTLRAPDGRLGNCDLVPAA